jgi:hypothetical protein
VPVGEEMNLDLTQFDPDKAGVPEMLSEALGRVPDKLRPNDVPDPFEPSFKASSVNLAAGEKVLEAGQLEEMAKRYDEDLRLVDMEGYGFARAVGPRWAIFRGIADYGTPSRDKNWQTYATVAAAVMLRGFLQVRYMPPEERNF